MAKIITKQNFEEEVLNQKLPVVVDFWSPWCGPCRMLAPVLEDFEEAHLGEIVVGKVNVDDEMELAEGFGINSIPCLILFKDGIPQKSLVGLQDLRGLESLLGKK